MYKKIKGYFPDIIDYFPDYKENPEYMPPKKYKWDIFSMKDSSMTNKFIFHSLNEKNIKDKEGERTVKVSEEVLNQLYSAHYFSKIKEKLCLYSLHQKSLVQLKENKRGR